MFLSSRHHLGSLLLTGRDPDSPQPWTLQVQSALLAFVLLSDQVDVK